MKIAIIVTVHSISAIMLYRYERVDMDIALFKSLEVV